MTPFDVMVALLVWIAVAVIVGIALGAAFRHCRSSAEEREAGPHAWTFYQDR